MRNVNLDTLKLWLLQNGPLAKEDLASKSRIKFFTLDKIIRGVRRPSELEQIALCKATGLSRDDLFPLDQKTKETA
jgi:hypothetical protein